MLPWEFQFLIALDPKTLWLMGGSDVVQKNTPPCTAGSYFDGLWNYDVIEFFFAGTEINYLEFHIAPEGRWWCHRFHGPLIRDPKYSAPKVISHTLSGSGWKTALEVPLEHVKSILLGNPTLANVTAKFNSQNQQYGSFERLPGEKPNFHQPAYFPKIELVKI